MNIRKLKNFIINKITSEIPASLSYHGVHHTLDVLHVCNQYIKRLKIPKSEAYLLRTAALMHDLGIMWNYSNHEEQAINYVKETLPEWGYSPSDIDVICNLIAATRIPQQPHTLMEEIICDADLDYLGTDRFYTVGETLFREFLVFKVISNEEEWDRLQVNFLSKHRFRTDWALRNREPVKQKYIQEIRDKWGWE
ncbi:MAG: hypothetical protein ACI83I_000850 [Bacteroidia bacterium]|jgi:uncharacterized protein